MDKTIKAAHDYLRQHTEVAAVYATSDDCLFENRSHAQMHASANKLELREVKREDVPAEESKESKTKAAAASKEAKKAAKAAEEAKALHGERLAELVALGAKDDGEYVRLGELAHTSGEQGLSAMDGKEWKALLAAWKKAAKAAQ